MFKYEWVWDKRSPTGHLNVKIKPMNQHDNVLVFCEQWPFYHPQYRDDVIRPFQENVSTNGKPNQVYGKAGSIRNFGVGYPKTILEFPRPTSDKLHPTQKPVALFAYLIRTYTNPGDLVLDNCIGSGTTAIAAIETGRNWIGIEQDPDYYRLAQERINERLAQPFLFSFTVAPAAQAVQQEMVMSE
jgi:site-specific DNA-methyltransferase (adenine-specific)